LIKGINKADQRAGRYQQHGFMLIVTCVLSFAAFMFAIDLSALSDDTCQPSSKNMAAQQVADTPAIPARQQSTPAAQPMRAVLAEAIATKIKAAYPHGNGAGLSTLSNAFAYLDAKSAEAPSITKPLQLVQINRASARAPPQSA